MPAQDKMGFLRGFLAHNVNVSDPETGLKWRKLRKDILEYAQRSTEGYDSRDLQKLTSMLTSENEVPDQLYEAGKTLEILVENPKKNHLKQDKLILKIISNFAEVAKLSQDPRVIQIAVHLSDLIIEAKKGN